MNTKLLLRVKEQILKEPRQFIMYEYFASNVDLEELRDFSGAPIDPALVIPNCGTAACIAGWAACLSRNTKPSDYCDFAFIDNLALSGDQETKLFRRNFWPEQFRDTEHLEGTQGFAEVAARRIDHFIATNGNE